MDEKVVLDTSVVVKWFVDEADSDKAIKLLNLYKENRIKIVVPEIICLELINALKFGVGFEEEALTKAISGFLILGLEMTPSFDFYFDEVIALMVKNNLASYDAFFVAAAKYKQLPLITADKKHHRKEIYPKIRYIDEVKV